jgi:hypothetical protein
MLRLGVAAPGATKAPSPGGKAGAGVGLVGASHGPPRQASAWLPAAPPKCVTGVASGGGQVVIAGRGALGSSVRRSASYRQAQAPAPDRDPASGIALCLVPLRRTQPPTARGVRHRLRNRRGRWSLWRPATPACAPCRMPRLRPSEVRHRDRVRRRAGGQEGSGRRSALPGCAPRGLVDATRRLRASRTARPPSAGRVAARAPPRSRAGRGGGWSSPVGASRPRSAARRVTSGPGVSVSVGRTTARACSLSCSSVLDWSAEDIARCRLGRTPRPGAPATRHGPEGRGQWGRPRGRPDVGVRGTPTVPPI